MQPERLSDPTYPMYMRTLTLYKASFPPHEQRNKPVILEIDPPVDSASQRRKAFYERCGFAENPYHVHPPYRRGSRGHELVVMSWLGLIAQPLYDSFARYLQQRVMYLIEWREKRYG